MTDSSHPLPPEREATTPHQAWRLAAALAAGFGVMSALVLWLVVAVASPPPVAKVAAILAVAVPFVFAAIAIRRAGREKRGG